MEKELRKELEQRGSAEITDGIVNQVTQALDENESEVTYLMFGELRKQGIIPINQACDKCDFWKSKFDNPKLCQSFQSGDAKARGFSKLICPQQLD